MLGLFVFYVIPFLGDIWFSMTDGTHLNRFILLRMGASGLKNIIFQARTEKHLDLLCCFNAAVLGIGFAYRFVAGWHHSRKEIRLHH